MRAIPDMNALVAFEVAARLRSFTLAGQELGLSSSTISRRISRLEEMVGVKLFLRSKPDLSLTPNGRRYFDRVKSHLKALEYDIELVRRVYSTR